MSNGAGAGVAAGGAADTDMTTGTAEKELPINLFFAAKEVLGTADAKDKARLSVLYGKEYLKRNIPLLNEGQEAPLVGPAARPADVEEDEPEIADKPPNGRVTCRMRLHNSVHCASVSIDAAWEAIAHFGRPAGASGRELPYPREFYDDFANAAVVHGEAFDKILAIMIKREGGRYGVRAVSNRATKSMEATRGNFEHRLALTHLTWEVFNTLDVHIPNEYEYGPELACMSDVVEATSSFQPRFVKVASNHLKWFKHVLGKDAPRHEEKFQEFIRVHWAEQMKGPFNNKARAEAGLTPAYVRAITVHNPKVPTKAERDDAAARLERGANGTDVTGDGLNYILSRITQNFAPSLFHRLIKMM